ncbi:DNA-binding FadR family transcriptional regulator [Nonomuraea thailandensis]|uniref:DNA-binding FadR family transcriptional regulator n=1 Tax=Nonomuraea thailandensis TaxID=1188745 RepID=A0A9X2GBT9_9ACTN|nr:FCD domain-containing protein [Nonomuraea thailandensis]MCP2356294.1 DNA-binding FadR family transcriptional regulator [Nonomuraea thailandensis]
MNALTALNSQALEGLRRLTALDTVRARIALAVDLGLLKPGERLPPAAEVARALDVGEITVRRALIALCEEGVLVRRRGRTGGTLVADEPAIGRVAEIEAYRTATAEVHRLIDQRLILECGLAHLAATAITPELLAELKALVGEMDQATDWAGFHTCDERFHLALAASSGVGSAAGHYGPVLRQLYHYYLPYPMDYLRESNREHAALVAALERHDPVEAVRVTRAHVEVLHRTMFVGLLR